MDHFYYSVLGKIEQVFTPDSAELQRIQERLHRFSKQELRNLDKNFHTFGVEGSFEMYGGNRRKYL